MMKEVTKARLEVESCKRQLYQQEIAYNIQQTEALTRSLSPTSAEAAAFVRTSSHSSFDTHSLPRKLGRHRMEEEDRKVRVSNHTFTNFLRFVLVLVEKNPRHFSFILFKQFL